MLECLGKPIWVKSQMWPWSRMETTERLEANERPGMESRPTLPQRPYSVTVSVKGDIQPRPNCLGVLSWYTCLANCPKTYLFWNNWFANREKLHHSYVSINSEWILFEWVGNLFSLSYLSDWLFVFLRFHQAIKPIVNLTERNFIVAPLPWPLHVHSVVPVFHLA